jgi:hypothetical protein
MQWKENFGMVVWILPFYLALSLGYAFPWLFGYIFVFGLTVTVVGLFVQVKVNEWQAPLVGGDLLKLIVDFRPHTLGSETSDYDYWKWSLSGALQLWFKDPPRERTDHVRGLEGTPHNCYVSKCWTTAILKASMKGIRHPRYNKGKKVSMVKFHYRGVWKDHIKGRKGMGSFRTSAVELPHADWLWVTEVVASKVDLAGAEDKNPRELMNQVPALLRDEDNFLKAVPEFVIKRSPGMIDYEEAEQRRVVLAAGLTR